MRTLKTLVAAVVILTTAALAQAETLEMVNYVPKDAKAVIETVDAAGLRAMLLESGFWKGLEQTPGFKQWRASDRYREMHARVERLLANLELPQDEALKAYLGGRSAVALLPGGDKPKGVILTEATADQSLRLVKACGGTEVKRYRDVAIYEVVRDNKTDRMAFTKDLLIVSRADGDQIERVLDVVVGGGPALGTEGHFKAAADGLPAGWRVRAYGAEVPPRKGPGAAAMYPKDGGRVHFEWRLVGGESNIALTAPVELQAPNVLPSNCVAAASTAAHLKALWDFAKTKLGAQGDKGEQKIRQIEMFWRGLFNGQTMDDITAAFGPEAAAALVKNETPESAPGAIVIVRLAENGKATADNFRKGLAAKAMLLAAMTANNPDAPKINVNETTYGDVPMLVIDAPAVTGKFFGDWAKDAAITVAVTNDWLIVGTTPTGVKRTIDTMNGKAKSLGAALKDAGETVPQGPATRWGAVLPQGMSDILIAWAEKLAGRQGAEKIKKMTDLAEALKLIKYFGFVRTDDENAIRGQADIQTVP